MRDTHFLKEQFEFLFLYRFNLMEYFKIYNEFHPNKQSMTKDSYDDVKTVQDKIKTLIHYDRPAKSNPSSFPIKITIPETYIETIKDLDDYAVQLNKKRAGFIMNSMHYTEPMQLVYGRFNAALFDVMYKHNLQALQDEAEQAIEYLVESCELTSEEREGFYRDFVNNSTALEAVLSILEQTCLEFITQVFDTETGEEYTAYDCGCWNHDLGKLKDKYIRKSFALKVAYQALDYSPMGSLWVYRCPNANGRNIWHMTKQNQRS